PPPTRPRRRAAARARSRRPNRRPHRRRPACRWPGPERTASPAAGPNERLVAPCPPRIALANDLQEETLADRHTAAPTATEPAVVAAPPSCCRRRRGRRRQPELRRLRAGRGAVWRQCTASQLCAGRSGPHHHCLGPRPHPSARREAAASTSTA